MVGYLPLNVGECLDSHLLSAFACGSAEECMRDCRRVHDNVFVDRYCDYFTYNAELKVGARGTCSSGSSSNNSNSNSNKNDTAAATIAATTATATTTRTTQQKQQ